MSVTINEMHTEVVPDVGATPATPPGGTPTAPARCSPDTWQDARIQVERRQRRTSARDFED